MNIQMRFPCQAGAEAQHWKIFVPPPHGQLSSSYPEEFRPYRPQIPPPFTQIGPRLAPSSHLLQISSSHLFSLFDLMNRRKHESLEGIINFPTLKKTRLTHIC